MMRAPSLRVSIKYIVIVTCLDVVGAFDAPPQPPLWFEDLVNYIQHNNDSYRQVIMITSRNPGETFENHWIRRILLTTMATYPTIRINVNFSSDPEEEWSFHRTDATATLFIFVDNIWPLELPPPKHIISIMKDLSLNKKIVKYLIILLTLEHIQNLDNLLRYGWQVQMIDLVILEVLYCGKEMTSIVKTCVDDLEWPVIHYFNPFLDSIIRKRYQPGIKLFPNLMGNMHGYPLKIGVRHWPPLSYVIWDENAKCKSMKGIDISLLHTLAEKMNFTIQILPQLVNYSEIIRNDDTPHGLFKLLSTEKIDIFATVNPHYTENISENSFRSATLFRDTLCALVPITREVPYNMAVIEALILTIGIVLIFWGLMWLFRFHQSWSVCITVRILVGIPVQANYSNLKPSQRMIIQILMIVSLFYSVNTFGSLAKARVDGDVEVEIKNFNELDDSGLIPIISHFLWNKTFDNINKNDRALMNLKNKAIMTTKLWECPANAEKYKNVTCLMGKGEGQLFVKSTYRRGLPTVKMTETCFWSDSYAFLVRAGSPYRKKIDGMIQRFAEVGLKKMWFRNDTNVKIWQINRDGELVNGIESKPTVTREPKGVVQKQLTAVLLFGCTAAMVAFIAELLWYHGIKRWNKTH